MAGECAGVLGIPTPRGSSAFSTPSPHWLLRGRRSPLPLAAVHSGSPASPALFTAVPDVQHLAGAPMTWEHKYLLFLPRTRSSDSQVTLPQLC